MTLPDLVNIVAMGRHTPPPDDMQGEIWSINNSHAVWKRGGVDYMPDLIIAMDDLGRDEKTHPSYVDEIVNSGVPVLNTRRVKKWPSVKAYPLKAVYKDFDNVRLYDNSINYAFLLALHRGYKEIRFWGTDFVERYDREMLNAAPVRWIKRGYRGCPEWFKYYDEHVIHWRAPSEPGQESFHYILGMATAHGVKCLFHRKSTALNMDRDEFFYGYQKQPNVL